MDIIYVVSRGKLLTLWDSGGHLGDGLMLCAVFFYAFYGVFLKKWQIKLPLLVSLYIQIIFAVIYHLPLITYFGLDHLNHQNISSILYAGIFPSIISPFLWMMAVQQIGPSRTSIFMNLMPILTAIIAVIWLDEKWTVYHTVGGICILVGILLAQKQKVRYTINKKLA